MTCKHSTLFWLAFALLMSAPVWAQNKYYSCDFESDSICGTWQMNRCATAQIAKSIKNHWFIGEPGNNTPRGQRGLFISDDSVSAHYTNSANLVLAYTPVTLEANSNGYMLTFDYRAVGSMVSTTDGLYAFWLPEKKDDESDFIPNCVASGSIPALYTDYMIRLQPDWDIDRLNGASTWRQCRAYIPKDMCDGQTHILAFGWLNGALPPQQPGACVDNINIVDARSCTSPDELQLSVSGSNITFSWSNTGAIKYEVSAYGYTDNMWYGPIELTDTFYVFQNIAAGTMDFYVRAQCSEDLWSMKTMLNKFVYYPDEMCIDYLNLTDENCFVDSNFGQGSSTATFDAFTPMLVDEGPASSLSRHTLHFDKNETDVITNCKDDKGVSHVLQTVPAGALASVRLGNTEVAANRGGGAERCEFSFIVDSTEFPVLELSYAVVIEAPNHTPDENSRFKMDILHYDSLTHRWVSLGSCVRADFNANDVYDVKNKVLTTTDPTWHLAPPLDNKTTNAENIVWKDWTTIGVNLSQYHGEELRVRFTTFDCVYHAHFGYAYFTLNCSDGNLKNLKCAVVNPDFEAPDGFVYRWLKRSDEQYRTPDGGVPEQYVLSREQTYHVDPMDDRVYAVDCMFEGDTSCYFTLYASSLATDPVAKMATPEITPDCKNDVYRVKFSSESFIEEINHVKGDTTISRQRLDSVVWDFGDGSLRSFEYAPMHSYSREGGEFNVTLRAHYVTCDSAITFHLSLPEIGPTNDTSVIYLCDADTATGYLWPVTNRYYKDYGIYADSTTSVETGCYIIKTLDLREPNRDTVKTRILDTQTYMFHGQVYNQPGTYKYISPACDTAAVLQLAIYEALRVGMDNVYYTCAGSPNVDITYNAYPAGQCEWFSMTFTDPKLNDITKSPLTDVITVNLPDGLQPNYYDGVATFYDSISGNVVLPFKIAVRYSADMIAQRWNDVLLIRNEQYNGGYTFSNYQWYRCDAKGTRLDTIQGATGSYLYEQTGLQKDSYYCASLTRTSDAVNLLVCPVQPQRAAVSDIPSLVSAGASFTVSGQGTAAWYDITGHCRATATYHDSPVTAPAAPGVYLLQLKGENVTSVHHVVVSE